MNLLVDVDGVIVQYDFRCLFKKYFDHEELDNSLVYAYSIEDVLGVPRNTVTAMFAIEAPRIPKLWVDNSTDSLKYLRAQGHVVYIWSKRAHFLGGTQPLIEWLNRSEIPFDYAASDPEELPNVAFDYQIDDSVPKLVENGLSVKHKLLFANPWNVKCRNVLNLFRLVYSWKEIEEIINE